MGEAKRRGTFEQRKAEAEVRDAATHGFRNMIREMRPHHVRQQAEQTRQMLTRYFSRVAKGVVIKLDEKKLTDYR